MYNKQLIYMKKLILVFALFITILSSAQENYKYVIKAYRLFRCIKMPPSESPVKLHADTNIASAKEPLGKSVTPPGKSA